MNLQKEGAPIDVVLEIKNISFKDDSQGFYIFYGTVTKKKKEKDSFEQDFPVKGYFYATSLTVGDIISVAGVWKSHPSYGLQIEAANIQMVKKNMDSTTFRMLSTGLLPFIRQGRAKTLVEAFGDKVFKVLEKTPEKIQQLLHLDNKKMDKILADYEAKKDNLPISSFCTLYDIPEKTVLKLAEHYSKAKVLSTIKKNPYILYEGKYARRISFNKTDAIAMQMGFSEDFSERLTCGVLEYLSRESARTGSTAIPIRPFVQFVANGLHVKEELIEATIRKMRNDAFGEIIVGGLNGEICIWEKRLYLAEQDIANRIEALLHAKEKTLHLPENLEQAVREAEDATEITLAESQKNAIMNALQSGFSVITGGPGVGKTTIIRCLLHILKQKGNDVRLGAPTGRAAKRMKEVTGEDAKTIHSLLKPDAPKKKEEKEKKAHGDSGIMTNGNDIPTLVFSPEDNEDDDNMEFSFSHNEFEPILADVFIIDEASMIDTSLMCSLLRAIPDCATVILVGDVDQLPSVKAGNVLFDIISSDAVPVARLSTIFRQAEGSRIIMSAHSVNEGKMPQLDDIPKEDDFHFIEANTEMDCLRIVDKLADYIPKKFSCNRNWDMQIFSPMKKGLLGTHSLNRMLQRKYQKDIDLFYRKSDLKNKKENLTKEELALLKEDYSHPVAYQGSRLFTVGDKVMQLKNDYKNEVFNGDVGIISQILPEAEEKKRTEESEDEYKARKNMFACISFPSADDSGELNVWYSKKKLFERIILAYVCTVHKSQGNEYPYIILPLVPSFSIMLQRKLLYTAITRGRSHVCLIGSRRAVHLAVTDTYKHLIGVRKTKLKYWLSQVVTSSERIKTRVEEVIENMRRNSGWGTVAWFYRRSSEQEAEAEEKEERLAI